MLTQRVLLNEMQNAFCWQAPAGSIATQWQQVVHAQQPPPNPPNPPSSSSSATDGEITFAIIYPESEDAAVGIVAQVLVTQKPLPALRSVLLSVYDSDVDAERNPYTCALVWPERIQLDDVLLALQFQLDCPPSSMQNHCSLWFGSVPVRQHQIVNVQSGYAFRLVISRGILLDIPHVLTLENALLRRTLQQAIHGQVFQRPEQPTFIHAAVTSPDLPDIPLLPDSRPEWIQRLQAVFNAGHFIDTDNRQPSLDIFTGFRFVMGSNTPSCHPFFWLVVWNMNFVFPINLGISSSQLIHIFQRSRPTTNQILITIHHG